MSRSKYSRGFLHHPATVVVGLAIVASLVVISYEVVSTVPVTDAAALNRQASVSVSEAQASIASVDAARTVAFIGDSYTNGAGASATQRRFTDLVSAKRGWLEINVAVGGTGYYHGVTSDAKAYPTQAIQAAASNPAVVFVTGGRSDINDFTSEPDNVIGSIHTTFSSLRKSLPSAIIIALDPLDDYRPLNQHFRDLAAEVKAGVESVGGTYVDIGQPLVGHRNLVGADTVHPNDAGHAAIAAALDKALPDTLGQGR